MYIRDSEYISIMIHLPNSLQHTNSMPVILTIADIIRHGEQQVGHPQQRQKHMIPSDVTPELVSAINDQLVTIGYKITPLAEE